MQFVDRVWVEARLGSSEVQVLDPRLRVRYTSGHLQGALHVPASKIFDAQGRVRPDEELGEMARSCGVRDDRPVVIYDQGDGQSGAMLAWILEYLGHDDVRFLRERIEEWRENGGEFFYRPVERRRSLFRMCVRHDRRASWREISDRDGENLVDARTREEFTGEVTVGGDRPGHIPGAVNLPWLRFVRASSGLFVGEQEARRIAQGAGLEPERPCIVYCRSGSRAAVVSLLLGVAGYPVRLYDGSWADWSTRSYLPVEVVGDSSHDPEGR